jgi:hypothetical protein
MRKSLKEIESVLQHHGYSIDTIIFNVMKTFKLKTLCNHVGFRKQDGYSASETITLMVMLPLILIKSVNAFYKSEFQKVTDMKKDAIYRLKNNEKMPWRALLLALAKQFQQLVNATKEIPDKSAFILDDTIHAKTGRRIENISWVFDHVPAKRAANLASRILPLAYLMEKASPP